MPKKIESLANFSLDLASGEMTPEARGLFVKQFAFLQQEFENLAFRNHELECREIARERQVKHGLDYTVQQNEEISGLRAENQVLKKSNETFEAALEELKSALVKKDQELEQARIRYNWLNNQLFGVKSEQRALKALTCAEQLWLFDQMLLLPDEPPPAEETMTETEENGRAGGGGNAKPRKPKAKTPRSPESEGFRLHFGPDVPIKEVIVEDPELKALPEDQVEIIGKTYDYKLAQNKSPYTVIKYVRTVWRLKGQEDQICKVKLSSVVEKSIADVSFLAGLAIDKHLYHLPVYRQHQRLQQAGIEVDRSTLTRLMHRVAEMSETIYLCHLASVVKSSVLTVDETPTSAGYKNGKMKKGYYWAMYGDQNELFFLYSPSRSRAVLEEFLSGFQGTLQSDAYGVYESFCKRREGVTWAGCWAHTRRKFINAEKHEPQKAEFVLKAIKMLYEFEEKGRGDPETLSKIRKEHSRPAVEGLFKHFQKELVTSNLPASNPYIKALSYALRAKNALETFLDNPLVAIDTNHVERAIRYPVMGRKNWLFHTTENGARHSAILYSLLYSCLLHDINPRDYLVDILQRMDSHLGHDAHLLTPRLWKSTVQDTPLTSVID